MFDTVSKKVFVWRFAATFEDAGNTPIQNGRYVFNNRFLYKPMPKDFEFPDYFEPRALAIGPRDTKTSGPIDVPPHILKQVQERRLNLYFWGWVAYRDIFAESKVHVTEFCEELTTVPQDPTVFTSGWQLLYSTGERHNCTDEDCPDYERIAAKIGR
jgi:hypothetical protein